MADCHSCFSAYSNPCVRSTIVLCCEPSMTCLQLHVDCAMGVLCKDFYVTRHTDPACKCVS